MAVPFNLPRSDEDDYQLIYELLMTVQRAVYQIIFRRSHTPPQHQLPPPSPQPRIVRGGCLRCGRGSDDGPRRRNDDDDNGARGGSPAAVPGGGERAAGDEAAAPGAAARRLPDVVPRDDAAAPAGEPTPPARRGRPQPPARRARRRWPPPPVPPPRGVRHAPAPRHSKYWENIGENLRHIADEFRPSPSKDLLRQPRSPHVKDTNVLALLFPRTVWAALILIAGWKLARKVR